MLRKGIRRNILFFLAALDDLYGEFSYSTAYKKLLYPDYKPNSVVRQLYRMARIGDIEKIVKDGKPYFRLTNKGKKEIVEDVPLFRFRNKKWDGWWRLVIFDIEEEKKSVREWLRKKLFSLGFGQWQRSVYISPHDLMDEMNRYLKSKNLFPSVVSLIASQKDLRKDQELAYRVWDLERIKEEYQKFIDKWEGKSEKDSVELWADYQFLLEEDPFLPKKLLPADWPARKAHNVFIGLLKDYKKKLKNIGN